MRRFTRRFRFGSSMANRFSAFHVVRVLRGHASPSWGEGMHRDSFAYHSLVKGSNIPERCESLLRWAESRIREETWSFCKTQIHRDGVRAKFRDWGGQHREGLNFSSQDYLGLAMDPRVKAAAQDLIATRGAHSAGSEVNGGTLPETDELASRLGELFHKHVVLFPTGWAAGYGAIRALIRPRDHIVLDRVAHNCLQEGALAATSNRHHFPHNDLVGLERELVKIRSQDRENAVLVVTESLFSMDSDGPNLVELVAMAHRYEAYVLLDCAHDFGVFGTEGAGKAEAAGVLSDVDFLMGSFSKVLAATGGFVASKWRQCTLHIQAFGQANTFSNHLGPAQVGAAAFALSIVTSLEGDKLRHEVLAYADELRTAISVVGFQCLGEASALIPVFIGKEQVGRLTCRELARSGVLTNFIEYPAVALGESRLRFQVSPHHRTVDCALVAQALTKARAAAQAMQS